jgi:hypothetical protein
MRQLGGKGVRAVGELELVQQRLGPRVAVGHAVESRRQRHVVARGQVVEQARLVGDEGHPALGLDRL